MTNSAISFLAAIFINSSGFGLKLVGNCPETEFGETWRTRKISPNRTYGKSSRQRPFHCSRLFQRNGCKTMPAIFQCERCGAAWSMGSLLSDSVQRAVAEIVHSGQIIPAVRRLTSEGIDLKDSKAIVSHLCRTSGKCHRCGADLVEKTEVENCHKCKSLNLNWWQCDPPQRSVP